MRQDGSRQQQEPEADRLPAARPSRRRRTARQPRDDRGHAVGAGERRRHLGRLERRIGERLLQRTRRRQHQVTPPGRETKPRFGGAFFLANGPGNPPPPPPTGSPPPPHPPPTPPTTS